MKPTDYLPVLWRLLPPHKSLGRLFSYFINSFIDKYRGMRFKLACIWPKLNRMHENAEIYLSKMNWWSMRTNVPKEWITRYYCVHLHRHFRCHLHQFLWKISSFSASSACLSPCWNYTYGSHVWVRIHNVSNCLPLASAARTNGGRTLMRTAGLGAKDDSLTLWYSWSLLIRCSEENTTSSVYCTKRLLGSTRLVKPASKCSGKKCERLAIAHIYRGTCRSPRVSSRGDRKKVQFSKTCLVCCSLSF